MIAAAGLLVVASLLSGCVSDEPSDDDAAASLLFSPDASPPAAAAEPTSTVAAEPASLPPFPEDCSDVVPAAKVADIVAAPIPGKTQYLYAEALPDIGRTARVTCSYGVGGKGGPDPEVEITVNEYQNANKAQTRIDLTLAAATERGNEVSEKAVGPYPGWILADKDDISLAVDAGKRTLVVTMVRGLVKPAAEPVVLERLAAHAMGLPTSTFDPIEP